MSDLGTMISRIGSEIHRTTINDQVKSAILSAIAHYEDTAPPFHFQTERATANTVDGQKYYAIPDDFDDFVGAFPLQITVNQSTYPLNRRAWDYLQLIDLDAVVGKGIPFDWAYGDNQIRLYPIPQDAYPLTLYFKKRLAAISADADTNSWTTDGERLIRARAKWDLYSSVIHQPEKAAVQKGIELEAEQVLRGRRQRRAISGYIQPHYL